MSEEKSIAETVKAMKINISADDVTYKCFKSLEQQLQACREDAERYRQESNSTSELAQKNLDKYFKAKDENEKLNYIIDKQDRHLATESAINLTLTQQNKQMREALEEIIKIDGVGECGSIAQQALEGE